MRGLRTIRTSVCFLGGSHAVPCTMSPGRFQQDSNLRCRLPPGETLLVVLRSRPDSNRRPLASEASALSGCATGALHDHEGSVLVIYNNPHESSNCIQRDEKHRAGLGDDAEATGLRPAEHTACSTRAWGE
jgi:hypothetical protein